MNSMPEPTKSGEQINDSQSPDYREGYAEGYVDAITEMNRRAADQEDRPSSSVEESRERLITAAMSALITVTVLDRETADALISVWRRREHLTFAELAAIRAAIGEPDDHGFAERFLEERRQAGTR
jgi:hypothetical protein